MARLAPDVPGGFYDLGCGPGTITLQLKQRWPERHVTGVDSSEEMLREARARDPGGTVTWQQGDIALWHADAPAALVFANASLHWLDDHEVLMPGLMRALAPGGTLAIQMPQTAGSRYTECAYEVARSPRWQARLGAVRLYSDAHPAPFYYDVLAPLAAEVEVWETTYHHVLQGIHPVRDFTEGTALRPMLSALDEAEWPAFLADYDAAVARRYPRQVDGTVLLDMRRLFIVARRAH